MCAWKSLTKNDLLKMVKLFLELVVLDGLYMLKNELIMKLMGKTRVWRCLLQIWNATVMTPHFAAPQYNNDDDDDVKIMKIMKIMKNFWINKKWLLIITWECPHKPPLPPPATSSSFTIFLFFKFSLFFFITYISTVYFFNF